MSLLDPATAALVAVAATANDASEEAFEALMREARGAGANAEWLEELVLGSVLFVGFPKALVAAAALRKVQPVSGDIGDAARYDQWQAWLARGEATGRRIYGSRFERLRQNVRALHPALEAWVVIDGYGRTISRPGLDLRRRELCAIAMLVPQGVPVQLHSHLRGALNAGASEADVDAALDIAARAPGADPVRVKAARTLWNGLRTKGSA